MFAQVNVFGNGRVIGERALDAEFEFIQLEGLLHIIVGPLFHGFQSRVDGAEAGNDDHHRRRTQGTGFVEDVHALRPRFVEIKIGDDEFGGDGFDGLQCGIAIGKGEHLMPFGADQLRDHLDHGHLIIGEQHFGHGSEAKSKPPFGASPIRERFCRRPLFPGRIDDLGHLEDRKEHADDDAAHDDSQENDQQRLDQ